MRCLLLDTCGALGEVGLADLPRSGAASKMLVSRTLPGRETQERLLLSIAGVLADAGLQIRDLQCFAVVTGPGSFTGVRVGLAAIKGLAEALRLPVIGMSRLAVLASAAKTTEPVQAWLDAGRGDIFRGQYQGGVCLREDLVQGVAAVRKLSENSVAVVAEERLLALSPWLRLVNHVGAAQMLPLVAAAVRASVYADIALLDANYLRTPDAELARLAQAATAGATL